jgi:hypothetical protein
MAAINPEDVRSWLRRNGLNADLWAEHVPIELVITDQGLDEEIYAKVTLRVSDGIEGSGVGDRDGKFLLKTQWIPFDFLESDRNSHD